MACCLVGAYLGRIATIVAFRVLCHVHDSFTVADWLTGRLAGWLYWKDLRGRQSGVEFGDAGRVANGLDCGAVSVSATAVAVVTIGEASVRCVNGTFELRAKAGVVIIQMRPARLMCLMAVSSSMDSWTPVSNRVLTEVRWLRFASNPVAMAATGSWLADFWHLD
ncbi:unnamed protein product [Heligmosomoides polygyrus]|uniref:Transmembrane protein n=1 Tax=Heligmosomoides polygyrus TaxID=6339 RepID=A0A183FRX6_HELPZ|nr:unnamed protein product [Heligmosomoides polygyrus]